MGTRSLTHIKDSEGAILCTIYRQFDGYPEGHGADLLKLLNDGDVKILNGYSPEKKSPEFFNGMRCLSAFVVGHLKFFQGKEPSGEPRNPIGGIYLVPPNRLEEPDCGQEFTYTLYCDNEPEWNERHTGDLKLKVQSHYSSNNFDYDGPLSEFGEAIEKWEERMRE